MGLTERRWVCFDGWVGGCENAREMLDVGGEGATLYSTPLWHKGHRIFYSFEGRERVGPQTLHEQLPLQLPSLVLSVCICFEVLFPFCLCRLSN